MINITLYHTYQLLYCTGNSLVTNNYNTIDVKKENKRINNVNIAFNTM